MHVSLDTIADAIPLSTAERARFAELEAAVENHLPTFLTVGRALVQIRNERLYRESYPTWELYCQKRWGFSYSHANDIARCAQVAEGLLASCAGPQGDAPLPDNLSPDALRPLQKLQPELQSACWRLASRIGKPTQHIVGRIVRVVTDAIHEGTNNGSAPKAKPPPASQKKIFLLSVHRLADSPWFSPQLIIQGLDEAKARKHIAACQQMISRLHELVGELRREFPEL